MNNSQMMTYGPGASPIDMNGIDVGNFNLQGSGGSNAERSSALRRVGERMVRSGLLYLCLGGAIYSFFKTNVVFMTLGGLLASLGTGLLVLGGVNEDVDVTTFGRTRRSTACVVLVCFVLTSMNALPNMQYSMPLAVCMAALPWAPLFYLVLRWRSVLNCLPGERFRCSALL